MIVESDDDFKLLSNDSISSLDNKDEDAYLFCRDCLEYYTKCTICGGYFENESFVCHHSLCKEIYKLNEKEENLLQCNSCYSFIKSEEFTAHQEICLNSKNILDRVECEYCKTLIEWEFLIDHEKECQSTLTELLLIKETIECSYCKNKIPLKESHNHENLCQKQTIQRQKIQKQIDIFEVKYPEEWGQEEESLQVIDENNLRIVTLKKESPQYQFVSNLIVNSMFIFNTQNLKIFRIENKYLWCKYHGEKAKIFHEKGEANERWLFHGTRANNPKILYNNGFDISFSSDNGLYGRGIYFAKNFIYSHKGYAFTEGDKKFIFLAKVITGMSYFSSKGNKFKKAPLYDDKNNIYYDSVTNVENDKNMYEGHMYVVYENDKAYPYYLIEYS